MPITLTLPWDLPAVRVRAHRVLEDGTLLIEVESTLQTAPCQRCGREIDRLPGSDRPIQLRHLPVFGREVLIESRPKRYRGPPGAGGPTTTQRCAWYAPNRPHPKAFEAGVLQLLVHRTVADVSRRLTLGVKAVEGILADQITPVVDWSAFTVLDTLGIDEGALCKGRGHDVAVVGARDAVETTHVLAVLPHRLQATVQAFLETIPAVLTTTGRQVCIDRWEGYAGAVAAALPAAQVGIARFPVAVQSRQAVDALRQPACRRLNARRPVDQTLPTAELRSLLRREGSSLNPAQQARLVRLFQQSPTLASAYLLRTPLTAIFEGTPDRITAQTRLQRWGERVKAAGISGCDQFLMTLQRWQDGILNYCNSRHNSGVVEGLNNKLKVLKRRCFGLDDPIKLFQRLWLDSEGPRQWL